MTPYFEKEFNKKGYIFLGWAEVGFVNIFSDDKLDSLKSLDGIKCGPGKVTLLLWNYLRR
jgi:hypothetical protein